MNRIFLWFCFVCLVFPVAGFAQSGAAAELTAEQQLAERLVSAKNEDEQNALLARSPDLINVKLRQAVSIAANRFRLAGEYERAVAGFDLARRIAEKINEKNAVSGSYNNIGVVYNDQGDYPKALEFYEKSLALKRAAADRPGIAFADNNIGLIYYHLGRYLEALERSNQAVIGAREIGDKYLESSALRNSALVQQRLGNHEQAQRLSEQALNLSRETGDKLDVAQMLSSIGLLYDEQQNYSAAADRHRQSLKFYEETSNKPGIARALNNFGFHFLRQRKFDEAIAYHENALKIAEEIKNARSQTVALINLSFIRLALDQPEAALPLAERAAGLSGQTGSDEYLIEAETMRGAALRRLKKFAAARVALETAVANIEKTRANLGAANSAGFFERNQKAYFQLLELEFDENNQAAALVAAERAKARVLLDVFANGRQSVNGMMTVSEQNEEADFNRRINALNRRAAMARVAAPRDEDKIKSLDAELEKVRLDYEAFRLNLYAARPKLRAARGETQIIKPSEIADQLAKDPTKVFLEYAVSDEATYLFVVSKAKRANAAAPVDIKVHKIPISRKDLTAKTDDFRQIIARRGAYEKPARELYELLVAPAAKDLAGKTKIVVVPDGALWNLPFQALQPKSNRFLLEDYVLSYAPSLTALREMRKIADRKRAASKTEKTLFAFGNPTYDVRQNEATANSAVLRGEPLGALPDAEREVNALANLYGAANSRIYVKAEAREDRAKTEGRDYGVLQFAAHGVFNDANPLYSHLVLAPNAATGDDGLLEARELLDLNLSADLVVLSACETARGRVQNGEGLTGMTWALFVAGVPTTVASQWKVPSNGTAEVMLGFHRNLLKSGKTADKAAALRQSELDFLRGGGSYRHPFYWAGFILIGND